MSRYVYISCHIEERENPIVAALRNYLRAARCIIQHTPAPSQDDSYRLTEDAIERCDAFIAIIGSGQADSPQLNFELHHAHNLRVSRLTFRPRLFGLRLDAMHPLSRLSEHIEMEWLDDHNRQIVLADWPTAKDAG